jgi:predicted nucleic acid-binding protein
MVLFDSNYLLHVLSHSVPGARPDDKKWVDKLVLKLQQSNERIVVPTPVLGEILVHADTAAPQYLDILHKATRFRVVPFDEIAAVKSSERLALDIKSGLGKQGGATGDWAVIKVDRQIVAVAEVEHVKTIYSNDKKIKILGERAGIVVINFDDLPAHLNPIP